MRLVRSGTQVPAWVALQSILPTFRQRRRSSAHAPTCARTRTTAIHSKGRRHHYTTPHLGTRYHPHTSAHMNKARTHVPTPPLNSVLPSSTTHPPAPALAPAQHPRSTSSRDARPSRVRAQIQTCAPCCVQRCMARYRRSQRSRIQTKHSRPTHARSRTSLCALSHDMRCLLHRVRRLARLYVLGIEGATAGGRGGA